MSIIKNFIIIIFVTTFISQVNAEEVKKLGTHKDWETYVVILIQVKFVLLNQNLFYNHPKKNPEKRGYLLALDLGKK